MPAPASRHAQDIDRRIWWACIAVAYVGLSFALIGGSKMWTGQFNDSDDYMRMVQVFNWLDGPGGLEGWYDLSQPRFAGDHDFILAWSRLVDLPLAGIIRLAEPWIGRMPAAGVAAFMVPLLLFGLFCFFAPLLGRGLIPRRQGWLLIAAALCTMQVVREMGPMRIDHHGWQMFLAMLDLICLLRYALRPDPLLRLLAGIVCALGIAIGAESLLWTVLTAGFIAADAAWRGGAARNRGAILYGLGLTAGVLLLLPVVRPPDEWRAHELLQLSLPHVLFAALYTVMLIGLRFAAAAPKPVRLAALAAAGAAAFGVFMHAVPEARFGIYADMATANQKLIIGNVIEARSYLWRLDTAIGGDWRHVRHYWPLVGQGLFIPLLGFGTALTMLWRTRGSRRQSLWAVQAALLTPVFLLAMAWQSRVMIYAQLYSLLPVAWLLYGAWRLAAPRGRPLAVTAALAALLTPTVITTQLALGTNLPRLIFYPSRSGKPECDLRTLADALNSPRFMAGGPKNIMTVLTGGAELLYRTRHRVFSAPYDLAGNKISYDFFAARDMGEARMIAGMHHIDLVVVCARYADVYYLDDDARTAREAFAYGLLGDMRLSPEADAKRIMIDRLTAGGWPSWLTRIPLPQPNLLLYNVNLSKPAAP